MHKQVKLANVVPTQLPTHIRDDYPTFEAFMKAYYEYLDQQKLTRSLEFARDIDYTLDEFVKNIKNEIAILAPNLAKDRFFLKHAKELYVSRGSEESYKFLFRLLYDKDVNVVQLNDKIFKISGGNWQQDVSFFVRLESGSISNLENNYVYVTSINDVGISQKHEKVYVQKAQKVEYVAEGNVYEVFINRQYFGKLVPGDTIDEFGVKATVLPTTSSVKIVNAGSGFKVGQIFNITTGLGSNLQIKVIKVDKDTGSLKAIQIVAFGVGFETSFDYNITATQQANATRTIQTTPDQITEILGEGKDYGQITRQNFHTDYAEGTYVGEVLADFYSRNYPDEVEVTVATLRINIGAIAAYPGFYKNSNSLISEDSYIHDGYYYQDFSYLLRIDEKLDVYHDIIKSTVHPAGRKMFGDYLIETNYDFTYEVINPLIRRFFPFQSDTNAEVDLYDKVLSNVQTAEFTGDGSTLDFTFLEAPAARYVVLSVRKGSGNTLHSCPIVDPSWYVTTKFDPVAEEQVDGKVTFYNAPLDGERVSIMYATVHTSESNAWLNHTLSIDKGLQSVTNGFNEHNTKVFTKVLSASTGYDDVATMSITSRKNAIGKSIPVDYATASDAAAFRLNRSVTDVAALMFDSVSVQPGKGIVDSFTAGDTSCTLAFNKYLNDSITVTDQLSVIQTRFASDEVTVLDVLKVTNADGAFISQAAVSDINAYVIQKGISEELNIVSSGWIQLNPYSSENYLPEGYQTGGIAIS